MFEEEFREKFLFRKSIQAKITPWSHTNEIFWKLWEDVYKIRIISPAESGKANKELIKYITSLLPSWYCVELSLWNSQQNKVLQLKKQED